MELGNLVTGQHVARDKLEVAKALRRSLTEEESSLWQRLRGSQLFGLHFRRQQVAAGFVLDFYCQRARLAVEVDGGVHADQADYDAARDRRLGELGVRVLRVTNAEVRADLPSVLARIAGAAGVDSIGREGQSAEPAKNGVGGFPLPAAGRGLGG